VVRAGTRLTLPLLLLALGWVPAAAAAAQEPASPPPPAVADSGAPVSGDPVGFLLEHKDSLHLAPGVVSELVQINLDLFRRTRRIQRSIDSIVPPAADAFGAPRQRALTPEQRQRLAPLLAARRAELQRAHDAAFALLTPDQQRQARQLEQRGAVRGRRPRGP
jgi:hypothetical protein